MKDTVTRIFVFFLLIYLFELIELTCIIVAHSTVYHIKHMHTVLRNIYS